MGDKGKKDKDKARKQKIKKQVRKTVWTKTNPEKLHGKNPSTRTPIIAARWWNVLIRIYL